jgi:hypothetical protein
LLAVLPILAGFHAFAGGLDESVSFWLPLTRSTEHLRVGVFL